jgi:arthrofactin-type cyclic lipopeptide synthetase C
MERSEVPASLSREDAVKARLDALPQAKRALLERWLAIEAKPSGHGRVVTRRPRASRRQLSFGQQRLWDWEQRNLCRSHALNLHYLLDIEGALDGAALGRALREIHRRHECLRMRFTASDTGVCIELDDDRLDRLSIEDLSHLPEANAVAEALRRGQALGSAPFALDAGPLSRSVLYQVASARGILLLAIHHLVFDQWSMGVVLRELRALYGAFTRNVQPLLPPLIVQYDDFAYWEREWVLSGEFESQRQYWSRQVANQPAPLKLPGYREGATDFLHVRRPVRFHEGLSARVAEAAKANNVSPYMILLSALGLTLGSLTGRTDFVIGSPMANRNYGNVENQIGFYVNNLPIYLSTPPARSAREHLLEVRRVSTEASANQQLPTSLIGVLRPESLRETPLYQTVFSYQNSPVPDVKLGDLKVRPLVLDYGMTTVDFSLFLIEAEALTSVSGELAGMVHYNGAVYGDEAMEGFWTKFVAATEDFLASLRSEL